MGASKITQLPEDSGTEIAISGRSNTGKSSILNVITSRSKLARISKTPGRTQQINIFSIDHQRRLVDLPGYGYAKVPEKMRRHWHSTLNRYFLERQSLAGFLLIMDIRHPLRAGDEQQIDWSLQTNIPTHILLNKADKISRGKGESVLQQLQKQIDADNISIQLFSVLKRTGVEELRAVLDRWFGYD